MTGLVDAQSGDQSFTVEWWNISYLRHQGRAELHHRTVFCQVETLASREVSEVSRHSSTPKSFG